MADITVSARNLSKRFDTIEAVRGVSFEVAAGECFGLLGPNGAGKTSTIRMIACVSPPTSGELYVLSMDVRQDGRDIKRRVGVVPQEDNLDEYLSLRENLDLYGRYYDLKGRDIAPRITRLLAFVQLSERTDSIVRDLSGGMRRRLLIARALITDPQLLILDEPTSGLDPQGRHLLWEKLRLLKAEARTLILTTHYMDEAEQLCDRLVIMENGRIIAHGKPRDLIREHTSREVVEVYGPRPARDSAAARLREKVDGIDQLDDRLLLFVRSAEPLVQALLGGDFGDLEILARRATLEDVFLKLAGRRLVE